MSKLPRKRKKAMIKAQGRCDYIADQILSETLNRHKFVRDGYFKNNKFHATKWW